MHGETIKYRIQVKLRIIWTRKNNRPSITTISDYILLTSKTCYMFRLFFTNVSLATSIKPPREKSCHEQKYY